MIYIYMIKKYKNFYIFVKQLKYKEYELQRTVIIR